MTYKREKIKMIQKMNQIRLEQTFIASLIALEKEGYKSLPSDFRTTVFSVSSHQEIFNIISKLKAENKPIDTKYICECGDEHIKREIAEIIGSIDVATYFSIEELPQVANELIKRAEAPTLRKYQQKSSDDYETIDTSKFTPLSPEGLIDILGLSIKKDEENKLITFLCQLSAYTEDSQLNISFNAPSSTGKSFIPMEISKLFPEEDVIEIAYSSPTAFFHDTGKFNEEKHGYVVNLECKIIIFLDQPHMLLLHHLRPLLSHDRKEIHLKITDKTEKRGLRTKNIIIRGYPAVIFCTAGLKIDEQESTRFLLLSPESTQEKIREAIEIRIKKETDSQKYKEWLESDQKRIMLKERIRAIKFENIQDIRIDAEEKVHDMFFQTVGILKPRHQRDIGRIIGLIKTFALLNLWFRKKEGRILIANDEDIENAFRLWNAISQSQELNLPPYIYQIYNEIILPLFRENRRKSLIDSSVISGINRREIIIGHMQVLGRPIADYLLRQQVLPMLEGSGLIIQEPDPNDKRRMLIYPVAEISSGLGINDVYPTPQLTIYSKENNSEWDGGVN